MSEDPRRNPFESFRVEIDPQKVEETLRGLREQLSDRVQEGRHTKVRISYKGKPIGPDIPFAVFLAGEGIAFWFSAIPALLLNLGAKAVLDISFIHEADELVQQGLAHWLDGDADAAERCYRRALERRQDDPSAWFNLGTLLRVTGRTDEALSALRRAAMGPEGHPDVRRAAEALAKLEQTGRSPL